MIGGFRQWEDIDDPRRSRGPVPQTQNIVGLPAAQGALVRAKAKNELILTDDGEFISKRSAYEQSGGTDRSLYERVAGYQSDDLKESNIGKLIRGESSEQDFSGVPSPWKEQLIAESQENENTRTGIKDIGTRRVVKDKNTGTKWLMDRDDLVSGPGRGTQGPIAKEIADYVRGMGANPGELEGIEPPKDLADKGLEVDPSETTVGTKKSTEPGAYSTAEVFLRDRKNKITGKTEGGRQATLDPKQIVETRDKDPDNVYNSERFEEVNLGKKVTEISNEAETKVIGRKALENLYREGRYTPIQTMTPEELAAAYSRYGINPEKPGTFAGVMDPGRTETFTSPSGETKTRDLSQPIFAPGKTIEGVFYPQQGRRTIPDGWYDSKEIEDQIFRIGNPMKYDAEQLRAELAPYLGMEMVGQPKRNTFGAKVATALSFQKIAELQKQGVEFIPITKDKSEAIAKIGDQEIRLVLDRENNRYIIPERFESFEVGPTVGLTRPGTVTRRAGLTTRQGDNVGGIRKTAERKGGPTLEELRRELIAGGTATETPDVTYQARMELADQIVRGKELGYSDEQINQLYNITEEGSTARQLLNEAITEKYQEVSPYSRGREVDLFTEELNPTGVGARRLREALEEAREKGTPFSTQDLYKLSDIIGERLGVPGNEIINAAGRRFNESSEYLATELEDAAKYGKSPEGYQIIDNEGPYADRGRDPEYTMPARAQISETNTPGSKLPLFKPVVPAEAQAVRDMAQADPTKLYGGTVDTSKTSMLNAPADQPVPVSGPVGMRPEERVLPNQIYGENVPYRDYRDMANKLGKEIGSADQEQAMAAMARRLAARLARRG